MRVAKKSKKTRIETGLAPNPVKKADTRAKAYIKQFGNRCWELDALKPDALQRMVKRSITQFIDKTTWNGRINEIEREREEVEAKLQKIKKTLDKVI